MNQLDRRRHVFNLSISGYDVLGIADELDTPAYIVDHDLREIHKNLDASPEACVGDWVILKPWVGCFERTLRIGVVTEIYEAEEWPAYPLMITIDMESWLDRTFTMSCRFPMSDLLVLNEMEVIALMAT